MRIIYISAGDDEARWDAYVGPRTTTVTDLSSWRRVALEAYGLRSLFLAAEEGDRLVGCLGLFEVRHPVFGRYLVAIGTNEEAVRLSGIDPRPIADKTRAQGAMAKAVRTTKIWRRIASS